MINEKQAQKIAQDDAKKQLEDMEPYKIVTTLQFDGWHVDFINQETKNLAAHYVIDEDKGCIVSSHFE